MRRIGAQHAFYLATTAVVLAAGCWPADAQSTPSFVDPGLRLERPSLTGLRAIRFLTTDDYPPLNFALPDGSLSGFNVEVARAICQELAIGCTVQVRPWDTLIDAMKSGKGDAIIASISASGSLREEIDFSIPYYKTPGRFVARRSAAPFPATPAGLAGRTVGVVAGTAHEAYLRVFFPRAQLKALATNADLESALKANDVDVAFVDGVTYSTWLSGGGAADCCEFRGGPYLESRFFGEGVGVAVRKDDPELRKAFNWALAELMKNGAYSEIYMKYFPIGFY